MLIRDCDDFIEIRSTDRIPDHLPTPGDTRVEIAIKSQGFEGKGSAWLAAPELEQFVEDFRELEATRYGAALLESMSPGEFRLKILIRDCGGHAELEGRLSKGRQVLQFGFDFCSSYLPTLVREFSAIAKGDLS